MAGRLAPSVANSANSASLVSTGIKRVAPGRAAYTPGDRLACCFFLLLTALGERPASGGRAVRQKVHTATSVSPRPPRPPRPPPTPTPTLPPTPLRVAGQSWDSSTWVQPACHARNATSELRGTCAHGMCMCMRTCILRTCICMRTCMCTYACICAASELTGTCDANASPGPITAAAAPYLAAVSEPNEVAAALVLVLRLGLGCLAAVRGVGLLST